MKLSKSLLIGASVAAVVAAGVAFNWPREQHPPADAQAPQSGEASEPKAPEGVIALDAQQIEASRIAVVTVGRGGGAETRVSGRVEAMVDARAAAGAAVGGRVERVLVAAGQLVRAGQPLVTLVSGDAASLAADVSAASAQAEAARLVYQRNRNLADQGVVARQEVEASRAQHAAAAAAAQAARARTSAAGSPNASGRLSITSPISGVVTGVQVGPGGFVAQGGVVAEVTDPTRVELVFNAPAGLANQVKVGSAIRVTGPAGDFQAEVTGVAANATPQSGAAVIRARAASAVLPPAGAAVTGAVVTQTGDQGLTVPADAIQTLESGPVVFVQVKEGFRARPVVVGRQAEGRTEIVSGLTGQERIASTNTFLLKAELSKGEAGHGH